MGDLYDWALALAKGESRWSNSTPQAWAQECARFFATLKKFDDRLLRGLFDLTK